MRAMDVGTEPVTRPVALITDEAALEEVLNIAAAARCDLERVPDVAGLRARWPTAPLVLLDRHAARCVAACGLPRRSRIVVISGPEPDAELWQDAVTIGAERVLDAESAERWLADAFADAVEAPASTAGRVLAVLGGRGGAGASVFAAGAALSELHDARSSLLVDCDPLGGGLDLVLGVESDSGPRWPQLRLTEGRIAARALHETLPGRRAGNAALTVLSCARDNTGPQRAAVAAVLDAGRRAGDTVICDLPRELSEPACAVLERADLTVLVIPAEVRAVAAAQRVAERVQRAGAQPYAVVRGPGSLRAEQVAAGAGVPLLATMRPEPGLDTRLEDGRMRLRRRGPLAGAVRSVLARLHERGER